MYFCRFISQIYLKVYHFIYQKKKKKRKNSVYKIHLINLWLSNIIFTKAFQALEQSTNVLASKKVLSEDWQAWKNTSIIREHQTMINQFLLWITPIQVLAYFSYFLNIKKIYKRSIITTRIIRVNDI